MLWEEAQNMQRPRGEQDGPLENWEGFIWPKAKPRPCRGNGGGAGGQTKCRAVLSVRVSLAKAAGAWLPDAAPEVREGAGLLAQTLRTSGVSKAPWDGRGVAGDRLRQRDPF